MKTKYFIVALLFFTLALGYYMLRFWLPDLRNRSFENSYHCEGCNVILISMTNLRYDHASFDGYTRDTTPNLDKLARNSLVFDNAFSHASWTLPESISIYTGLYPYQHGVMSRSDGSTLSKNTLTLIDFLNNNGYKTAAFTGGFDYNPEFGATSRFQTYQECAGGQTQTYPRQPGPRNGTNGNELYGGLDCTVPKAVDWLKQNSNSKFFLQVQGFDAHCPFNQTAKDVYDPNYNGGVDFSNCIWTKGKEDPTIKDGKSYYSVLTTVDGSQKQILLSPADVEHLISIYDTSIHTADGYIGNLLNEVDDLGLSNKTIIVFTSEHGDIFGKNGRFMRGGPASGTFYDDVLHIPLIMQLPNVAARNVDGLTAQIDLMPTLLDLIGIKNTAKIEGKSLVPLIFGNIKVNDYIFAGSYFNSNNIDPKSPDSISSVDVVRSLDWKLIRETVWDNNEGNLSKLLVSDELYDLKNDKEELNDVSGTNGNKLNSMNNLLNLWLRKVKQK